MEPEGAANQLFYGDNLDILDRYIPRASVDLIYLDPPFKSNQDYNVLFTEQNGSRAAAQIKAFEDTWRWDQAAAAAYFDIVNEGGRVAETMEAFRTILGESDMMAYLAMMAPRLVHLHRVLKPTGSIYLHCDPTASHYLKLLMDAVFGANNFRTEIIWKRTTAHSDAKQGRCQHGRIHDTILFYTKSSKWTWNHVYVQYDEQYEKKKYCHIEPETGRRYHLGDLSGPGGAAKGNPHYELMGVTRYWRYSKSKMEELIRQGRIVQPSPGAVPRYKRYLDEMPGLSLGDVWTDITPINSQAAERLGYPTQKPESLLERIIKTSSNEGDVVLDPFCGCGTAVSVAQRLGRRWRGIDITHIAITLIKARMKDAYGDEAQFEVHGEPVTAQDAATLAENDPYQFQMWALGLIGARPTELKKGPDRGIDGKLFFFDDRSGKAKHIIISVKSGHITRAHIHELRGVIERERAAIGVLISLEEHTRPMREEAASAGFYESPWGRNYPRIQLRTVEDLMAGKGIERPPSSYAFKRAPRAQLAGATAPDMFAY